MNQELLTFQRNQRLSENNMKIKYIGNRLSLQKLQKFSQTFLPDSFSDWHVNQNATQI